MNWQQFCGCDAAVQANCLFNITAVYKNDLSPCLQMLLQAAVSALLFLVSVSYVFNFFGYKHSRVSPISPVHYISIFRAWSCVFIAFSTLALGLIQTDEFDGANKTYWVSSPVTDYHSTIVLLYGVATVSHVFLVTALVPSGVQYPTHLSVNIQTEGSETESLITGTNDVSYRTFTAQQATTRGEDGNILSRLFFWWVQPLMKRGKLGFIQTADDVFLLPKSLDTQKVASKFYSNLCQAQQDHQVNGKPLNTLMAALHRTFGLEYYALGVMKLLADGLGFAGPLLLNALISYMENPSEVVWHGYMYAAGLFASTLAASLLTAHFDYLVKKIGIKFSSGIISCVYKKMLSVSTVELSHFTTGETVNFMSTDVDRTVNFCTSFHQFWSLPFQIGVSLFLLYQQVGWSFLAGVAFAIVLIPVNRKIAIKIGDLSSKMMGQKDCRVQTMNEMIFGIRVIKLFCWEDYFVDRVNRQRSAELSSLKARKYLDALCVYFWATTPVIISILTFTTYSLLGNELTAAKVFTSLALFNMLIGPLNAFPWVVNGLVEAWVSVKRVQQFVDLNSSLQSHFWSGEDGSVTIDTSSFSWRFADTEAKEQQQIEATEQQQTEGIHQGLPTLF
ncbi:ABCC10 [Bugula neritina]|uniref:ABC-type xenobiotic transporter n=1 Tax=Bugula neritina TaxID=10212 RepID=A0A7J7K6U4_BUGNE|nr:ABCC10 [Bugula neritina]